MGDNYTSLSAQPPRAVNDFFFFLSVAAFQTFRERGWVQIRRLISYANTGFQIRQEQLYKAFL